MSKTPENDQYLIAWNIERPEIAHVIEADVVIDSAYTRLTAAQARNIASELLKIADKTESNVGNNQTLCISKDMLLKIVNDTEQ